MKLRAIILLVLLVLLKNICYAQTQWEDVVYLKNGSIIRGVIIEQIPNKSIKIKSDRNVFVYQMDEIEKMTKEEIPVTNNNTAPSGAIASGVKMDESELREALEKKIFEESKGSLKMVGFTKTDGASRVVDGQSWYDIRFTVDIQPQRTIWKNGNSVMGGFSNQTLWANFKVMLAQPTGWDAQLMPDTKEYPAYKTVRLTGRSEAYKSEKGWNVTVLKFLKEEFNITPSTTTSSSSSSYGSSGNKPAVNTNVNIYAAYLKPVKLISLNNALYDVTEQTMEISNKCTGCDTTFSKLILNKMYYTFKASKRFMKAGSPPEGTIVKYKIEVALKSLSFDFPANITLLSPAYVKIVYSYTVFDSIGNQLSTKDFTVRHDSYNRDVTKMQLVSDLIKDELAIEIKKMSYLYTPMRVGFGTVTETSKNGEPKFVNLTGVSNLDPDLKYYFIIFEEGDLKLVDGNIKIGKIVAYADSKKFDGDNVSCKVTSGETDLKQYVANGKKLVALAIPK